MVIKPREWMVSERVNHDTSECVLKNQTEREKERGGVLELQGESENHICVTNMNKDLRRI